MSPRPSSILWRRELFLRIVHTGCPKRYFTILMCCNSVCNWHRGTNHGLYDSPTQKVVYVTHVKELICLSQVTRTIKQKMVSVQEKAQCVEWFIQTRSDIQVRKNFRTRYERPPPRWCNTTLGFRSEADAGQDIPRTLDRKGRSNCMASQIPRHDIPGLLFLGLCQRPSL